MGILSYVDAIRKAKKSIFSLTILTSIVAASIVSTQEHHHQAVEQLPFCGDRNQRTISRRLLYVSTLDGKVTALDLTRNGKVRWSLSTDPGALISSSIHRLELTNNGQFVRMIPSLSGGIYKFDGESIDPIPITAENLLSSSFKFSDDLVISGGKETRSYGVSARTGQILYECSMNGCVNNTDSDALRFPTNEEGEPIGGGPNAYITSHDPLLDDVVVVRRQTQTVRAIESRTGNERWNFSVAQHELDIMKSAECHDRPITEADMAVLGLDIKLVIPEGLVCAFSKTNPAILLWKHKFDHPIVSAWRTSSKDELEPVDIFRLPREVWDNQPPENRNPSIYLGMYHKQLYIQESTSLRREILDRSNVFSHHMVSSKSTMPKIPWRPVSAKNALVLYGSSAVKATGSSSNELVPYDEESRAVAALSVLYASEYVNGNGFYLYTNNKSSDTLCDTDNSSSSATSQSMLNEYNFSFDDETPVKIVILSLWFWWKEIVVISLTSAMLLNLFIGPRIRREREIVVIERHIPVPTAIEATEESVSNNRSERTLSESNSQCSESNFSSRFQSDFDLIRCLGKGGFGVVFEAKNKLDDCNYAVKRITLPNKKESRDRVMREVKTLANCEHQNIVRYFQAWVETPPPGWQEEEDGKWLAMDMSTSIEIETPDGTTLPSFPKHSTYSNDKKRLESWVSYATTTSNSNYKNSRIKEEEDSFEIEFKSETGNQIVPSNRTDSISIDMHLNGANPQDLDCGNLSDSFEIEFVKSTDGENSNEALDNNSNVDDTSNALYNRSKKFRRRPKSLDLTNQTSAHDRAALVPMQNGSNYNPITAQKVQNKVYLYIQMQLCRKQSLRDWLREHRIEMRRPRVKNIFNQIVDAVDYVHLKGLIHRDLKPGNIFFSLDGQIKIGDFGLVTDMSDNVACGDSNFSLQPPGRHTQRVGTHLYMSPEQISGKNYDFKVDIFSLGLIFFELLVFFGTEMERIVTLKGLRDGKFPSEFQSEFPKEFDLLTMMLSTSPDNRPTTNELKQKLNVLNSFEDHVDLATNGELCEK